MTGQRWRNDHATLAAVAAHLHARRVVGYPDLVTSGRMAQATADAGIRVMGAIARGWHAIAALEPEPVDLDDARCGGAWRFERIPALDIAARAARAAADEFPYDFQLVGLADAIDTLIWWETAEPDARWYADFNILAQADARHRAATETPHDNRPSPLALAPGQDRRSRPASDPRRPLRAGGHGR